MKTLTPAACAALLAFAPFAIADTLNSGLSLATSSAFNSTGSFWNHVSSDVVNGSDQVNVGNFLNDTGAFALNGNVTLGCPTCGVNYMASGGQMYVNASNTPDYVNNLNFVKQAGGLDITLLYANSASNGFAEVGIYDASSAVNAINNHVVLQPGQTTNLNNDIGTVYTSGTQFTSGVNNGVVSLGSGSPYADWGLYVTTCTEGSVTLRQCTDDGDVVTYYMGEPSQLNANQTPYDSAHEHFALFQAGTNADQYYAGLEDLAFTIGDPDPGTGVEGYGDYNDLVFGITTSGPVTTPEPATFVMLGMGLGIAAVMAGAKRFRLSIRLRAH